METFNTEIDALVTLALAGALISAGWLALAWLPTPEEYLRTGRNLSRFFWRLYGPR